MMDENIAIESLQPPASDATLHGLAELLIDAVESGAAVSFLAPLSSSTARDWWERAINKSHANPIFLIAREGDDIVGHVQLQPAWAPNQPHRAEVSKLLVHTRRRGAGLGRTLMESVEKAARLAGFTLLTLDAKAGGTADRLYRRMGWVHVGTIPEFALDPDGKTPHDAAIFYKKLTE